MMAHVGDGPYSRDGPCGPSPGGVFDDVFDGCVVIDGGFAREHASDVRFFLAFERGECSTWVTPDEDGAVGGGGDDDVGSGRKRARGDWSGVGYRAHVRELTGFVIEYAKVSVEAGDCDGGAVGGGDV